MLSPCAYALTLTKAFPVSCFELAYEYSLDIKLRVDLFKLECYLAKYPNALGRFLKTVGFEMEAKLLQGF